MLRRSRIAIAPDQRGGRRGASADDRAADLDAVEKGSDGSRIGTDGAPEEADSLGIDGGLPLGGESPQRLVRLLGNLSDVEGGHDGRMC